MNANSYDQRRAALERLMQEFVSASSATTPLLQQRLSGSPDQELTKETWEDFAGRRELEQSKGKWERWVPYRGTIWCSTNNEESESYCWVCSRFYGGSDEALALFRRLAETGVALLSAMSLDHHETWYFDSSLVDQIESVRSDDSYLYWLEALLLTARRCRTMFLDVTLGNWQHERSPGETVEQAASQMSEPTSFGMVAFPINPVIESLQYDVFRSSVEAIKVWLGIDDVVHVGDWPDRPPIYLPATSRGVDREEVHESPSVGIPVEQHGQDTSSTPDDPSKLLVDRETFSVRYRGKRCDLGSIKEFYVLERLNIRPGVYVSISALIDDVWDDENTENGTVQRTISNLRKKLRENEPEPITEIEIENQGDRYRLKLI